ncbi:calcineurin-like phosphoesterase family protein [Pirellulales bacterium]|nr:calcineurin-like phosphoesterase family protein [Pirellulales bacterium]
MPISFHKLVFLACLLVAGSAFPAHGETARGTVFSDQNQNGALDAGEPGLAGIHVSNGRDVTTTNAAGRYELAIDDDDIVFVIKPTDWQTQYDKNHLPRFYYIHKPAGSPDSDFHFKGVAPTGPLPASIDFPLSPSPEPEEFTVILMGDPQPYSRREVRYYANDVVAELVDTKARFGISLGDVVGDDLSLFEYVNNVQGVVGVPWHNVLGNHDMNFRSPTDEHSDETFERVYGPADYAFVVSNVHFVVLDNVVWKGTTVDLATGEQKPAGYRPGLSEDQLNFVKNYVALVPKNERIVICTHIPLVVPEWRGENGPELKQLLEILSGNPHTMSFSAHTHFNQHDFAGPAHGYQPKHGGEHHHHNVVTGSGSWYRGPIDEQGFPTATMADGSPNGYIVATFRGSKYRLRYKAARMPESYQMAIHAPEVLPAADTAGEVLANVFNGSKNSRVKMRVRGHGDWIVMQPTRRADPGFAAARKHDEPLAEREGRTQYPAPLETPHMWTARLPAGLSAGVHILEVQSTDMFDQVDRGIRLVEVE